jgi:hypothetical protein
MEVARQRPSIFVVNATGAEGCMLELDSLIGEAPLLLFQRELVWLKSRGRQSESRKLDLGIRRMRPRPMAIWYYGKKNGLEIAALAARRIEQFLQSGDFQCLDSSVGLMMGGTPGSDSQIKRYLEDTAKSSLHKASTSAVASPPPPTSAPPRKAVAAAPPPPKRKKTAPSAKAKPSPAAPVLPALSGQLADQNLPQVLQYLHQNHKTGELNLKTANRGALFAIRRGELEYAESGGLMGAEAVFACAGEKDGAFWFMSMERLPDRERNVHQSMMDIAFECCRLMDEAGLVEESRDGDPAVSGEQASALGNLWDQ